MRFSALALLALIAFASPAFAAPAIDAAGAEKLKKIVEETLASHEGLRKATGNGFTLGGNLAVAPKGDAYDVTLPDVTVETQQAKIKLGTLVLRAKPQDENSYNITTTLPQLIALQDPKGTPTADIKLGRQTLSGLWRADLATLTKAQADFGDVVMEGKTAENPFNLSAGALSFVTDLAENADKTFSGTQKASGSNIRLNISGTEKAPRSTTITFDSFANENVMKRMDLAEASRIEKKILALYEGGKTPKPEELHAITTESPSSGLSLVDEATQNGSISGISIDISADPKVKGATPMKIALGKVDTSSSFTGARQDIGGASAKMNFTGLSVTGASDVMAGMIPSSGTMQGSLSQLPVKELIKALADFSSSALERINLPEDEAEKKEDAQTTATINKIFDSLAKAKTRLTVDNTQLIARDMTARLAGAVTADAPKTPETKMSMTGSMVLSLLGIDEMAKKFQEKMKTDATANATAQVALVLQLLGQPGNAEAGKSLRHYKFEIDPNGKFLLNGMDISAVTAMMQGPPAKQ